METPNHQGNWGLVQLVVLSDDNRCVTGWWAQSSELVAAHASGPRTVLPQ